MGFSHWYRPIYLSFFKKTLAFENTSTVKLHASISELPLIKFLGLLHSLWISEHRERERCDIKKSHYHRLKSITKLKFIQLNNGDRLISQQTFEYENLMNYIITHTVQMIEDDFSDTNAAWFYSANIKLISLLNFTL